MVWFRSEITCACVFILYEGCDLMHAQKMNPQDTSSLRYYCDCTVTCGPRQQRYRGISL